MGGNSERNLKAILRKIYLRWFRAIAHTIIGLPIYHERASGLSANVIVRNNFRINTNLYG
jgi:hypothetical protein